MKTLRTMLVLLIVVSAFTSLSAFAQFVTMHTIKVEGVSPNSTLVNNNFGIASVGGTAKVTLDGTVYTNVPFDYTYTEESAPLNGPGCTLANGSLVLHFAPAGAADLAMLMGGTDCHTDATVTNSAQRMAFVINKPLTTGGVAININGGAGDVEGSVYGITTGGRVYIHVDGNYSK